MHILQIPQNFSLQLLTWTSSDISRWLDEIGLGQYEYVFSESVTDGELLATLTEEDMREEMKVRAGVASIEYRSSSGICFVSEIIRAQMLRGHKQPVLFTTP